MSPTTNNHLLVLQVEKEAVERQLKEKIKSLRYTLDNLEAKLDNKEKIYGSEGLQGDAVYLDVAVNRIATYDRAIDKLEAMVEEEE